MANYKLHGRRQKKRTTQQWQDRPWLFLSAFFDHPQIKETWDALVLNLAQKRYASCVTKHVVDGTRVVLVSPGPPADREAAAAGGLQELAKNCVVFCLCEPEARCVLHQGLPPINQHIISPDTPKKRKGDTKKKKRKGDTKKKKKKKKQKTKARKTQRQDQPSSS
jgi:hypothetical protein